MNSWEGLLFGFDVALTSEHVLAALIGALAGLIVGILPGLGPVAGAAILLPLTLTMSPTAGLIMIAGIYYGTTYGGSTTAILLNMPGEAASVVTAMDGYQMTRQGRAGPALGIAALGSFVAGTLSVVLVTLFTPVLARVGLAFGPAEFFALTVGGVIVLSQMFGKDVVGGLLSTALGFVIGTVGIEGGTGTQRFTMGSLEMGEGIGLVAVAVGLFGLAEVLVVMEDPRQPTWSGRMRVRQLIPTGQDLRRSAAPLARGGVLGFVLGLLPGPSTAMATFGSYRIEQAVSRHRRELGTGAVEGVAGPESANNAAATSSVIPVLALGLPFSATLALMLSALIAHGINPGPLIAVQHPEVFWGVIASLYIGNVMLFILNVPLIGAWVRLLQVKLVYLLPGIIVLAIAGTYASRHLIMDMWWVAAFGALGYVMRWLGLQLAPLLLGLVLSPLAEKHFREGMTLSAGDATYLMWSSPIVIVIWIGVIAAVAAGPIARRRRRRLTRRKETPT